MNGKRIKVNDFKFKYGQETIFINVFGAFKYKKNNNKYVIYSYDNSKLYYGSLFIRDNELVIMLSKNDGENLINKFLDDILTGNSDSDFEVISLDKIISAQIIDEGVINKKIDINKLDELTIPKKKTSEVVNENKKKKRISISGIFFALFIVVVVAFFFFNPEVIVGKDKNYVCDREYNHNTLSVFVREEVKLTFSGKGKVKNSVVINNYIFNSDSRYNKFKNNGEFYKYMNEGDTYKFIDEEKTYRVMSTSYQNVKPEIKAQIEKKTTKIANQIKARHRKVKPGIKTKICFYLMRMLHTKGWDEADLAYWREKGWDKDQRQIGRAHV